MVGVLDLAAIFLGTFPHTDRWFNAAWSVGSVGVITFLGVYMLEGFIGKLQGTSRAEVRTSIAISFMTVYFVVFGLVLFRAGGLTDTDVAKSLVGNFTYLVGVVVAFYFGSTVVGSLKGGQSQGSE